MEQSNAPSTKGKGLGMAAMIIGIVALVLSIIPLLGMIAVYLGGPGLLMAIIAFFMAKSGNNPKKGAIITAIILNVVAVAIAVWQIYTVAHAAMNMGNDLQNMLDTMKFDTISVH